MPRGDGTGPGGQGPRTGRGMGGCIGRGQERGMGTGRGQGTGKGSGRGMGKAGFQNFNPQPFIDQSSSVQNQKSLKAVVDMNKCTGCKICINVCPQQAITLDNIARIDPNKCNGCGICINECPVQAISLK